MWQLQWKKSQSKKSRTYPCLNSFSPASALEEHVIGTMSTTLLLAYSGGFITLLMLFMTKNAHFTRVINLKIVASEIMRTLIGSVNLILVAPLTALIASWLFCGAKLPVTLKGLEKSYSKPLDADSFSAFTILQHLSPFANFLKPCARPSLCGATGTSLWLCPLVRMYCKYIPPVLKAHA